ncbi:Uncharacterised protein [Vibrio cholerae]|nr:Uncharacterised protein [Vibrio cholerae]
MVMDNVEQFIAKGIRVQHVLHPEHKLAFARFHLG